MSYLVFARKYRPQSFDQVVQQEHVTRTLANAIAANRVSHAILFTGPRGTGKTTVARILAKAMNCETGPTATPCNQCRSCLEITGGHAADVFEIDGASNNSVDQIRELRENLKYMPARTRFKIYIIDEVHMLSLAAFNALLKTLEEPPAHVLFIFATTEPQKIPVTIMSRCQRHDLRRIDLTSITAHMSEICNREGVGMDEESLAMIAQESGGSMRDALSLLDHVLACADSEVSPDLVAELLGAADRKHLFDLSSAIFSGDIQSVLEKINYVWRRGLEMKRFYADLVAHFYHLNLVKLGDRAAGLVDLPHFEINRMASQVSTVSSSYLAQVLEIMIGSEPSIKFSSQPKLALEMVFLKLFQTPPTLPIETFIERLDKLREGVPQVASVALPQHPIEETHSPDLPKEELSGYSVVIGEAPAVDDVERQVPKPGSSPPVTLPSGKAIWDRIVGYAEVNKPSLYGFLKKCNVAAGPFEDNRMDIEVGGNAFTLKSIQRHLSYIEECCLELFGQKVTFNLIANCEDVEAKQQARDKAEQQKKDALSHPLVMETLELFNGKVIDVKVP